MFGIKFIEFSIFVTNKIIAPSESTLNDSRIGTRNAKRIKKTKLILWFFFIYLGICKRILIRGVNQLYIFKNFLSSNPEPFSIPWCIKYLLKARSLSFV